MCGIAGFRTRRPADPPVVHAMTEALRHRGPDEAGFYSSAHGDGPFYAGGMRRLSINDVAEGHQPLFNMARSVALLYNGEIYNYPELRKELEGKGYRFRTHSDGEVICHLYDEMGESLFERLDGMFAVALWDEPRRRLILARDQAGEKPLYYADLGGGDVAFASELPALKRFPGIDLRLDPQALWDFPTFLWVPEPATIYRGVSAVPHGHRLVAEAGGLRLEAIPNRFNPDPLPKADAEVVAETRRVVTQAVESRLLSDVPVGAFLSSGLDSSIVATLARHALGRLTTFSIGFEDVDDPYHGRADESVAAAAYARRLGTEHHVIRVNAGMFRDDLATLCRHAGQPFAVSSGLGILAVARRARECGVKVLLSGDGADECFGGYSWYSYLSGPGGMPGGAAPSVPVSFQNFGVPLSERLALLATRSPQERAWGWHYYAAESEKARLFASEPFAGVGTSLRHFAAFNPAGDWKPEEFIAHDRSFYLPFEMMVKLDRMSMAMSVEGRAPFVAPSVLAHAGKLRYRHMVRGDTLKWALREAFADLLPPEVTARAKHGFNVPIDHWLKREWRGLLDHTLSSDSALAQAGLLGAEAAATAETMLHDSRRLNGHTLFCLVMLNLWLEQEGVTTL
jgi:asparagine synthase (glutamine-hydrolysing)